ncbi:MAG: formate dehydrogenase [Xanthobacteraceae bacterium]
MQRQSKANPGRRNFLCTLGLGATAAAATAAPLAKSAHADTESNEEKRKARYRETEHVKAYYRVNRYPG